MVRTLAALDWRRVRQRGPDEADMGQEGEIERLLPCGFIEGLEGIRPAGRRRWLRGDPVRRGRSPLHRLIPEGSRGR